MQVSEVLYDIIVAPKEGIQKFRLLRKNLLISIIIVLIGIFSQTLASLIINSPPLGYLTFFLSFGFISKFLFILSFWIFLAAMFHFLASWSGGTGKVKELFILLGIGFIPCSLLPAGAILAKALGPTGYMLYAIFYLFLLVWFVRLQILSLKEVYSIPTEKAFFIYIAPLLIAVAFGFILFLLGIGSIIFLIASNI